MVNKKLKIQDSHRCRSKMDNQWRSASYLYVEVYVKDSQSMLSGVKDLRKSKFKIVIKKSV